MTKTKNTKRSRVAMAGLVGFAALTLSACNEEKTEASVFTSEAECRADAAKPDSWWTESECAASFAQAQDRHLNNAPRYDAKQVCEEQHGVGMCESDVTQAGGGSSIFMPLMAGYFLGNMMNNSNNYQSSRPVYPSATGGYRTADGKTKVSSLSGKTSFGASSFKPAAKTINKPAMSKATVSARGGFGASRTSSSSRSSFGG
jgi:uncharacterized protein YgiB involved in biofilm formation